MESLRAARLDRWWATPRATYALLCAVLFVPLICFYLFAPFGFTDPNRDLWHHLAVLRELTIHPWAPSNPHIPTDEPSRYYTPIFLLASMIANLFGLSATTTLGLVGAATCVGVCVSLRFFAAPYFRSDWAPHLLLLATLFGWGIQDGHVGFHAYASFTSSAAYPTNQAFVVGIFLWGAVLRSVTGARTDGWTVMVFCLTPLLVLTHQLTAGLMLGGAGGLALFAGSATLVRRGVIVAVLGAGALSSLVWPYFDLITVLGSASDDRWRSVVTKTDLLSYQALLALPAALGAAIALASPRRFPELVLPIVTFAAMWFILAVLDHPITHRVFVGFVLYGQLGLVWVALRYGPTLAASLSAKAVPAFALLFAVLIGQAWQPRILELVAGDDRLAGVVDQVSASVPGDGVAFVTDSIVYPYQSTGRRVVSIPRPEPAAPSLQDRQAATRAFFDGETTSAERSALMRRWKAEHVAYFEGDLDPKALSQIEELGEVSELDLGISLVTVAP